MSGLIGGLLRRHLEQTGGYELTALNRWPVEGVRCFQADISDLESIEQAFEGQDRQYSIYLSHRDVGKVLHRCIEAPNDLLYDVFLATSNNKWGYCDLEHSRQVIGYELRDSADSFR